MKIDAYLWQGTRDLTDAEFERAVAGVRAARRAAAEARAYTRQMDEATGGVSTRAAGTTSADELLRGLARVGLTAREIEAHFSGLR